ncbi:MAG TPA: hypothetical protein PKW06_04695, partial [Cyclobacteriaceae bacterium]|nr:hypothetical protein [Cyclobacteriaceae bacterium]
ACRPQRHNNTTRNLLIAGTNSKYRELWQRQKTPIIVYFRNPLLSGGGVQLIQMAVVFSRIDEKG